MARVKPVTAAFVVSYCTALSLAMNAEFEAMFTMLPLPVRRMAGMAALAHKSVPLDVHAQNGVPTLLAGFGHILVHSDGGVIHQNIEMTEVINRTLDEG